MLTGPVNNQLNLEQRIIRHSHHTRGAYNQQLKLTLYITTRFSQTLQHVFTSATWLQILCTNSFFKFRNSLLSRIQTVENDYFPTSYSRMICKILISTLPYEKQECRATTIYKEHVRQVDQGTCIRSIPQPAVVHAKSRP